jgi:eukaryotic-like serine/threonine-protein kinase
VPCVCGAACAGALRQVHARRKVRGTFNVPVDVPQGPPNPSSRVVVAAPRPSLAPAARGGETIPDGTVVAGRYLLQGIIGEGGMGCVYSALSLTDRVQVAIKFLHAEILRDPSSVARFLAEARAMVTISSEHVVRVFGVGDGTDGRPPYIVMEYLQGEDLNTLLERDGALSVEQTCDYLLQCCVAVSEAHQAGVVHRDIKPANFWLQQRASGPHLKLLDFGIAKAEGPQTDQRLTETTTTFGSPTYMSPEQVRSAKHVDLRADVWALGVVAYELLSGRLPFDSPTTGGTLAAIIADDPAQLTSPRGPLPPALIEVVMLALTKNRVQRYPSVKAFADQLAVFASPAGRAVAAQVRNVVATGDAKDSGEWNADAALLRIRQSAGNVATASTFVGASTNSAMLPPKPAPRSRYALVVAVLVSVSCTVALLAFGALYMAHRQSNTGQAGAPVGTAPVLPSTTASASVTTANTGVTTASATSTAEQAIATIAPVRPTALVPTPAGGIKTHKPTPTATAVAAPVVTQKPPDPYGR